jgi:hypothetical protein
MKVVEMGRSDDRVPEDDSPGGATQSPAPAQEHRTSGADSSYEQSGSSSKANTPPAAAGHAAVSEPPVIGHGFINRLATPQGAALLTFLALLVSCASFLANTNFSHISILGPILFFFLSLLAWRQRRKALAIGLVILFLGSLLLAIRVYSAPSVVAFSYDGEPVDNGGIPFGANQPGVPLTEDPVRKSSEIV